MGNLAVKVVSIFGCLTCLLPQALGQAGMPLWTNRYNGPGNDYDYAYAVTAAGNGDIFVTGYSYGKGGFPYADFATVAYSSAGELLWTRRFNASGNSDDEAFTIAVDGAGNVLVAGYTSASTNSPFLRDWATIKYSSTGLPLWTNAYGGISNGDESAHALAVDKDGNVFVTGSSLNGTNGGSDTSTIKYSEAGVPLWTNIYHGPGNGWDEPAALVVDGNGDVFVAGNSPGTDHELDFITLKYSAAGTPLWTNRFGRTDHCLDYVYGLAIDNEGDVFVTGYSSASSLGSTRDYATIKYSSAGVPVWTNFYNGPTNQDDEPWAITVSRAGNVFVTGWSSRGLLKYDCATVAYSNDGVPLWTNRYNAPGNYSAGGRAITSDTAGNVFVAGSSPSPAGAGNYATLAYSSTGVPLWTNLYQNGSSQAITVDSWGNVIVTGYAWNGTNNDYVTIKYSSSLPPPRLGFERASPGLILTWTNAGFNLQSAPDITETFTNIPGATSPFTNPMTGPQQFFRLISD